MIRQAPDVALFLVFDRPEREAERPGLWRTYFAQRCVSDAYLDAMIGAFRSVGAYVEVFEGERSWIDALADGRLQSLPQQTKIVFNGIGWGIGSDGFMPGRKALVPLIADSYGITCVNSDAHACAVTVHKFHSSLITAELGIRTPRTWNYRSSRGWIEGGPPHGTRVIAKSTYEAWSVGVTTDSVFVVDDTADDRVASIAERIGQAVTVQEFVAGREVYVPVWSCPERIVAPLMEAGPARAPNDPDAITMIDDSLVEGGVRYRRFEGPAGLTDRLIGEALRIVEVFDLYGLARIDFRVDSDGKPWVFDIAIDPGLAPGNSVFQSLAQYGFDHPSFLRTVIATTLSAKGLLRV